MTQAPVQEKYHDSNPVVRFVLRRFFERIRAAIHEIAPATILDAGCGEGEIARRGVLPERTPVISLDLRHESLLYFRKHSAYRNQVCGSLHSIPLPDRSVDAVLCLEVLEHLPDPGMALKELARVGRKALIVSVPHEPYFRLGNVLRGKHLERWGDHPEHIQHWNPRSFRDFLGLVCQDADIAEAFPWIVASCRLR